MTAQNNTTTTTNNTLLAYPIWNRSSHGPTIPVDEIINEDQQPLVWVVAQTDEKLAEKIGKVLPLL